MEDIIIKYLNQTATENEMRALLEWLDENIDNQRQFAITRDYGLHRKPLSLHAMLRVQCFHPFQGKCTGI